MMTALYVYFLIGLSVACFDSYVNEATRNDDTPLFDILIILEFVIWFWWLYLYMLYSDNKKQNKGKIDVIHIKGKFSKKDYETDERRSKEERQETCEKPVD